MALRSGQAALTAFEHLILLVQIFPGNLLLHALFLLLFLDVAIVHGGALTDAIVELLLLSFVAYFELFVLLLEHGKVRVAWVEQVVIVIIIIGAISVSHSLISGIGATLTLWFFPWIGIFVAWTALTARAGWISQAISPFLRLDYTAPVTMGLRGGAVALPRLLRCCWLALPTFGRERISRPCCRHSHLIIGSLQVTQRQVVVLIEIKRCIVVFFIAYVYCFLDNFNVILILSLFSLRRLFNRGNKRCKTVHCHIYFVLRLQLTETGKESLWLVIQPSHKIADLRLDLTHLANSIRLLIFEFTQWR